MYNCANYRDRFLVTCPGEICYDFGTVLSNSQQSLKNGIIPVQFKCMNN